MKSIRLIFFPILLTVLLSGCAGGQSHYVRYLHRHMNEEDEKAYKPEFWEENVAKALEVRDKTGRIYPRRFFRYFVLPVRVGEEPLDRFRAVYADSLCRLVEGMDPEEAVIAINTWCRYQAYFKEGWDKIQSAMGTIEYGYGLCSDLTVLTVNAMRAAGFPARRVVTTWADFRSDHAWLEVYVNDRWAMMSASEPYAKLDTNAWLNSRRVMCAEIDVIGDYHGPETVLSRNGRITRVSNLSKYAPVRKAGVSVFDSSGRPVKGAKVQFLMYHEGGLHILASTKTGGRGRTVAELGGGDVLALAYKDGLFGLAKVPGDKDEVGLMLNHGISSRNYAEFELSPPPENPDWRYIKSNDDYWAPMDSVKVAGLRAHPADEARVQAFIDEPRRPYVPEIKWPVAGTTGLILLSEGGINWGKELSLYKLEGGTLIPVNQTNIPSGTYLVVTGTALSEKNRYSVRLETFQVADDIPEITIPVTMPSI